MQNKSPLSTGLVLIAIAALVLLSRGSPEPRLLRAETPAIDKSGSPDTSEKYGQLPLYFFENPGWLDPSVKYYLPGRNKNVYFAPRGVVYELFAPPSRPLAPAVQPAFYAADRADRRASRERWAVKLGFVGSEPGSARLGRRAGGGPAELLPGRSSFLEDQCCVVPEYPLSAALARDRSGANGRRTAFEI